MNLPFMSFVSSISNPPQFEFVGRFPTSENVLGDNMTLLFHPSIPVEARLELPPHGDPGAQRAVPELGVDVDVLVEVFALLRGEVVRLQPLPVVLVHLCNGRTKTLIVAWPSSKVLSSYVMFSNESIFTPTVMGLHGLQDGMYAIASPVGGVAFCRAIRNDERGQCHTMS